MKALFRAIFGLGCLHKNLSFPQTPRPGQRRILAAALTGTYVVCTDCGAELPYDWEEMRVLAPSRAKAKTLSVAERSAL